MAPPPAANGRGWLYRFDLPSTIMEGSLGATHASEIAFTFNSFSRPDLPGIVMHDGNDPAVVDLARKWSDTVLAFARTGDPNGGGLPEWPAYRADERRSLVLDRESYIADASLDARQRRLWEDP
ncbi:MAG: carboxylesterase family protein [Gammaproteobacteria bacterium]|nr:carboxylesterase family protein [Gammaproteobacteria bacterium]